MHREAGERRDFLPSFVTALDAAGAEEIIVEKGYGSAMDINESDYLTASSKLVFRPREDCVGQDAVIQIRCMDETDLEQLRAGTILLSMLHYPTRPDRVCTLAELEISAVSLDGLIDDSGRRLSRTSPLWQTTAWKPHSTNCPGDTRLSTIRVVPPSAWRFSGPGRLDRMPCGQHLATAIMSAGTR
jgi:hypothetical protein